MATIDGSASELLDRLCEKLEGLISGNPEWGNDPQVREVMDLVALARRMPSADLTGQLLLGW